MLNVSQAGYKFHENFWIVFTFCSLFCSYRKSSKILKNFLKGWPDSNLVDLEFKKKIQLPMPWPAQSEANSFSQLLNLTSLQLIIIGEVYWLNRKTFTLNKRRDLAMGSGWIFSALITWAPPFSRTIHPWKVNWSWNSSTKNSKPLSTKSNFDRTISFSTSCDLIWDSRWTFN